MTKEEIDTMWQQAMQESIKDGEMFTRYHFAKLVAEKEREAWEQFYPDIGKPQLEMKVQGPHHVVCQCNKCKAQPEQEHVAWKLVPVNPTNEMLKAMDECSTEGYDERLYAGHASSVYMAAVDAAPTPPQRKPLTDKDILANETLRYYFGQNGGAGPVSKQGRRVVDAIEAAHGIKENT